MTTVSMVTNAAETFMVRPSASRRVSDIHYPLAFALPSTGPEPCSVASAYRYYDKAR